MKQQSLMGLMDDLLKQARYEEKRAQTEDGSDPTAHPVMKADPGTKPATEGTRSSENESDVREELGEAGNTGQEDAAAATPLEKDPADSVGTQTSDADELRGNAQDPKATKDAPPGKGPGDETFGEKYSAAAIVEAGNKLLAAFSSLPGRHKKAQEAGAECAEKKKDEKKEDGEEEEEKEEDEKSAEKRAAAQKYQEDAEAGYVAAHLITEQLFNKKAEEETAASIAENIIKTAHADAEMLDQYLLGREKGASAAASLKKASLGKRAQPVIPPEALAAAAPEAGMIPPEALAAAAPEAGAVPPGAGSELGVPPGGPEGAVDEEAALDALAEALAEANVTPEQLAATIAEAQEGGLPEEAMGAGEEGVVEEGAGEEEEEAGEEEEEAGEEEVREEKGAQLKGSLKTALLNLVRN